MTATSKTMSDEEIKQFAREVFEELATWPRGSTVGDVLILLEARGDERAAIARECVSPEFLNSTIERRQ